jgi:pSer/pThr/pTyr-binding forkhead associated (FHA) protein
MLCPNCQHWNEEGANFCEECGGDLRGAAQSPAPVSVKPASKPVRPVTASSPVDVPGGLPTIVASTGQGQDADQTVLPYSGPRLELAATGSIFKLGDRVVVGREDPRLEIDLEGYPDSKFISHHHAQLTRVNDQQYVEDLGSSNGTYVNNRKLGSGQIEPVTAGDVIRFGKLEMTYRDS